MPTFVSNIRLLESDEWRNLPFIASIGLRIFSNKSDNVGPFSSKPLFPYRSEPKA